MSFAIWDPQSVLQLKSADDAVPEWQCIGRAHERFRCGWTIRAGEMGRIHELTAAMAAQMPDQIDYDVLLQLARSCLCVQVHRGHLEADVIYQWTELLQNEASRLRGMGFDYFAVPTETSTDDDTETAKAAEATDDETKSNAASELLNSATVHSPGTYTFCLISCQSNRPSDISVPPTLGFFSPQSPSMSDILTPPPTAGLPVALSPSVTAFPSFRQLDDYNRLLEEAHAKHEALLAKTDELVSRFDQISNPRKGSLLAAWTLLSLLVAMLVGMAHDAAVEFVGLFHIPKSPRIASYRSSLGLALAAVMAAVSCFLFAFDLGWTSRPPSIPWLLGSFTVGWI